MEKKFIFGIGTGRCGSKSLTVLLNHQIGALITHEFYRNGKRSQKPLPWKTDNDKFLIALAKISNRSNPIVGDVSFFWLNYVDKIISIYPDAKFIGLVRDREEVIASYIRKTGKRNHWGISGKSDPYWDHCYPNFNVKDKGEAIGLYWDTYNDKVESLKVDHPNNVIIVDTKGINDIDTQKRIFDFCDINKPTLIQGICENASLTNNINTPYSYIHIDNNKTDMLSICMTNKNRIDVMSAGKKIGILSNCLKSIQKSIGGLGLETEIIVSNWDNKEEHVLKQMLREIMGDNVSVKVVPMNEKVFSRGMGLNVAYRNSKGNKLMFLDTDMIVPSNLIRKGIEFIDMNKVLFPICWSFRDKNHSKGYWRRQGWGNVMINNIMFEMTNGWIDRKSYGKEDEDFHRRCQVKGFKMIRSTFKGFYHQWHPLASDSYSGH